MKQPHRSSISRRSVLRGVGACIALPFLESLYPSKVFASQVSRGSAPKRFACLYMPNGVRADRWTPEKTGFDFELSPILSPLRPVKDQLLIMSGMMNKNSDTREDGHYTKTANFLTCMRIAKTVDANVDSGGKSLDQLMADHIGKDTMFPSLQYGIDRIRSGVDTAVGFTQLYGGTISWQSRNQPCSREIDPRMAFDRMFRNYVPGKKPLPHDPLKKSVLDLVQREARNLESQLGIEDQNKLGEYLEAVRAVEKRLHDRQNLKDFESQITPDIRKELQRMDVRIDEWAEYAEGVDITEKTRLMLDIIVLAFWSDASRVATFMFGNAVSNRNFSFLDGVSSGFHSVSHHKKDPRNLDQYERINRWHIEQYAYLLQRLQSIREGDGTLLDNSMIMCGSGLRDGDRHSPYDLPIVVGGKAGGAFRTGQNLALPDRTPLANLYLSMLDAMNIDQPQFGDSTGLLCDIVV